MTKNKPVKKTETTLLDQYIKDFRNISEMQDFSGKKMWDKISEHIDRLIKKPISGHKINEFKSDLFKKLKMMEAICEDKIKALEDLGKSTNSRFDKSLEGWAKLKANIEQSGKTLIDKVLDKKQIFGKFTEKLAKTVSTTKGKPSLNL
jgi:hypothetical protein